MTDRRVRPAAATIHALTLWALAVVHPLLDLLGHSPEFFVAHGAGPTEILLVTIALLLILPLPLVAAIHVVGRIGPRVQMSVQGAVVTVLIAALALQVLNRAGTETWTVAIPSAVAVGVALGIAYLRVAALRTFVTVLSVAVIAVPAVFLLQPGIRRLLVPPPEPLADLPPPDPARFRASPVVLLVADETPLVSILDGEGRIDGTLYPHIAALARDGRWFRNATAVADYTRWALPAMVTGRYPRAGALPNTADHPQNLFTLLGRTHRLEVVQAATDLCPESLCPRRTVQLTDRLSAMGSDIRIVALHLLLPEDLRGSLPPLTSDWANFDPEGWRRERRRERAVRWRRRPDKLQIAEAFLRSISREDPQPTFYYFHTLLTHYPHYLLPTGQRNATRAAIPGQAGARWNTDEWAIAQQYQRHLLQVGQLDAFVGRLIDRLRSEGLYDRALIVLASDHGIAYRPGAPRRDFSPMTAPDIMRVPFIVKLPAGASWRGPVPEAGPAEASDRNVETVDIAPTVADALGLDLPWTADGTSVLDESQPARASKRIAYASGTETRTFERAGPDARPMIDAKLSRFGAHENPWRVPRPDRHGELVGRPIARLRVLGGRTVVELSHAAEFENVDTRAAAVPFDVGGTVADIPGDEPLYVAVAVNGTVRAVTSTWPSEPNRFLATPPLDSWRDGRNQVEVFTLHVDPRGTYLRRTVQASP